jgi:hypothetical protein
LIPGKIHEVRNALEMEPVQVQLEIKKLIEMINSSFSQDKITAPNKTRLFTFGVRSKTTRRINSYMAVTTTDHCSMNFPVEYGKFRVQVKTKADQPGPDWIHSLRWKKTGGKEWWEIEPKDQRVSMKIIRCISKARKSMKS